MKTLGKIVYEVAAGLSLAWASVCLYMYYIGHIKHFATAGYVTMIAIDTRLLP